MGNLSGVVAVLAVMVRPSLVVPHVQVPDIRHLDWEALHANGVRYLVFDKDNCLTAPHSDVLEPSISEAWQRCQRVFGRENILIVSNSSGSSDDPSGLGAESLSRALNVPVLCHKHKKPALGCATEALEYFVALSHDRETTLAHAQQMPPGSASIEAGSSRQSKKYLRERRRIIKTQIPVDQGSHGSILLVGDRIMTDIVVAHRMNDELWRRRKKLGLGTAQPDASTSRPSPQCISVLTTGIWAYEGRLNAMMRRLERRATSFLIGKAFQPGASGLLSFNKSASHTGIEWQKIATVRVADSKALMTSPAETDEARFAYTRDHLPATSPIEPTLGAILIATIVRPLPPRFASVVTRMLSSRPLVWFSTNLRDGWNVMIRGLDFGVRQTGIQAHSHRSRVIAHLAQASTSTCSHHATAPSTRSGIELDEVAPRSRAEIKKHESAASLADYIESRIPRISTTWLPAMNGAAQQLRNRLSNATAPAISAQSLLARTCARKSTCATNATVERRTFCSAARRQQQMPRNVGRGGRPRVPMRNWIAAFSALVIVPGSYYLGMRLHDLKDTKAIDLNQPLAPTRAAPLLDHEQHRLRDAELIREAAHPDASRALLKASADRKSELELTLFHLVRERDDILDKLKRVQQRTVDASS